MIISTDKSPLIMVVPRAYSRVIRKSLCVAFIAICALFALSSYTHHPSIHPHPTSPSLFFIPSFLNPDTEISSPLAKNGYHKSEENGSTENGNIKETEKRIALVKEHGKRVDTFKENGTSFHFVKENGKNIRKPKHKYDNFEKIRNGNPQKAVSDGQPATNIAQGISTKQHDLPLQSQQPPVLRQPTPSANSSTVKMPNEIYKYKYNSIIDKRRKTKNLWKGDPECQTYEVHFAKKGALPLCALASYPGSGNTWTRRLLEGASGIYTGSIYSDQQLFVNGYFGELEPWTSGTTIAQKTHDCGPTHVEAFNNTAILLLRNPYRAILSFHNYLFGGHTGFAPLSNYRRKDWGKFVHLQAKSWLELAINWTTLSNPKSLTVLHYEHLQENPVPALDRALKTHGFFPDPERMECLKKAHSYSTFKRKEEFIPEKLEIFSGRNSDKIDRAIRYVDYLLRQRGQPPIPLHLYEFYNGTTPTHITRVSCQKRETAAQCDNRIDSLNKVRQTIKSKKTNVQEMENTRKTKTGTKTKETERERENRAKLTEGEETDKLEKFVRTKTGDMLTNLFVSIMSSLQKDPIDAMLQSSTSLSLQERDLHFNTKGHQEAFVLMEDFRGGAW